jgi:macrolide transport system ATP-binding/permease protein
MKAYIRKLIWVFQRRRKEDEIREELQFHLEEDRDERQAEGVAPEQAKWAAHRDLGNVTLIEENVRRVWLWVFVEQLAQDIRYALRMVRKNPVFTILATLSLGLGIGANTAIFSFVDALLLRALPVSDPSSLVVLNWHAHYHGASPRISQQVPVVQSLSGTTYDDPTGPNSGIFPYPAFKFFQQELSQQKQNAGFSSLFAYMPAGILNLTIHDQASRANGEYVSGEYFYGLNVRPLAGRLILSGDDKVGATPVVVLSAGLSRKTFGAGDAVGQSILINNHPFTVVGVTPPEFFGVDPARVPELYLPMHANLLLGGTWFTWAAKDYLDPHFYSTQMMGRLRPGVGLQQAQTVLAPVFHQWVKSTATDDRALENLPTLALQEGAGGLDTLRRRFSKPLYVLLTLVALILAIACANVANLLLARAEARRREIALRLSLGAGRLRILRQLLTESILLASFGGVAGILIAFWGIRFLTVLLARGDNGFALRAGLSWHVLCLTAGLSLLTGVLFGLAPALRSTSPDVAPALKQVGAREPGSLARFGLSHVLVVSQIALSLLMLVAAGLFVRTLKNLQSVEIGFNRDNMLLFELDAKQAGHKTPEMLTFYDDLQKTFSALPGVQSVSLSHDSLLAAGTGYPISVPGGEPDEATKILFIGPKYFATMQIPVLAGRDLNEDDQPGTAPVVILNEVFAQKNFGKLNPLGRHLFFQHNGAKQEMEIIGISRNAHYGGVKQTIPPVVYIPYNQGFPQLQQMIYVLRTAGDPLAYVNSVRQIVHKADPHLPVADVRTQAGEIDESISQEITFAKLCTAFAVLALIIACVGLYGTVSYNIARRTMEIGIRMALGAQRVSVVWMVLREVCLLAVLGLAVSIPTTFATTRFLQSFLFQMKANDPVTLGFAIITLLSFALIAGYLPARRASRIDPMIALRHE